MFDKDRLVAAIWAHCENTVITTVIYCALTYISNAVRDVGTRRMCKAYDNNMYPCESDIIVLVTIIYVVGVIVSVVAALISVLSSDLLDSCIDHFRRKPNTLVYQLYVLGGWVLSTVVFCGLWYNINVIDTYYGHYLVFYTMSWLALLGVIALVYTGISDVISIFNEEHIKDVTE